MSAEALLQVEIRHRQGPLALEVAFCLTAPWTVLFGTSGSGKTTVLRTIAGFVRPDNGRVMLGARPLTDVAARLFVPPHLRGLRSAGQAAKLFARMTVRENVAWGTEENSGLVEQVLRLFRMEQMAEKLPEELSGGERQRVSVARSVASAVSGEAALLLLDEPFAGLDYALRDALVIELRDWLQARKIPVLSVTHDVGEVFLLEAETIRMENGRVAEQGPVERVLAEERKRLLGQLRG